MVSKEEFLKSITDFELRVNEAISETERFPIYDGAINPERYFDVLKTTNAPRLMYLLKEAYDEDGGGWAYRDLFKTGADELLKKPTWSTLAYSSYGIQENLLWNDMPFIKEDSSVKESLNDVCIVNIQKLPGLNGSRTNMNDIRKAYKNHKAFIDEQIDFYKPNIIICGGTFSVLREETSYDFVDWVGEVEIYERNGIHYIDAYHPSYRGIGQEVYVDDLVNTFRKLKNVK